MVATTTINGYFEPSLLRYQPIPQPPRASRKPKCPVGCPKKCQKTLIPCGHYHQEACWCIDLWSPNTLVFVVASCNYSSSSSNFANAAIQGDDAIMSL